MRIGILTQALYNNYGGIIQNYALQSILRKFGHEVITLDWDYYWTTYEPPTFKSKMRDTIRTAINRLLNRPANFWWIRKKIYYKIAENNQLFISRNIRKSKRLYTYNDFKNFAVENKLEAFVVGSDQVWRPKYNKREILYRMYLDFTKGMNVKRISYASSFGVDNWEYGNEETITCSILANSFDAISVREESGVNLCRENLGVDAKWVLDPTMLLDKEDYLSVIEQESVTKHSGEMYSYILDHNPNVDNAISETRIKLGIKDFSVYPRHCDNRTTNINECSQFTSPSVCHWLRAFADAKYVICDSFHGAVFCIIFNKPFVVLGNKKRGLTRFISLLSLFELEDRLLIDNYSNLHDVLLRSINWEKVNKKRSQLKSASLDFLNRSIS